LPRLLDRYEDGGQVDGCGHRAIVVRRGLGVHVT
jgi:hypothetical protein